MIIDQKSSILDHSQVAATLTRLQHPADNEFVGLDVDLKTPVSEVFLVAVFNDGIPT